MQKQSNWWRLNRITLTILGMGLIAFGVSISNEDYLLRIISIPSGFLFVVLGVGH